MKSVTLVLPVGAEVDVNDELVDGTTDVDFFNQALQTVFGADCDIDWRDSRTVVVTTETEVL